MSAAIPVSPQFASPLAITSEAHTQGSLDCSLRAERQNRAGWCVA